MWLYEVCGEAMAQEELLYAVYRCDSDVLQNTLEMRTETVFDL